MYLIREKSAGSYDVYSALSQMNSPYTGIPYTGIPYTGILYSGKNVQG